MRLAMHFLGSRFKQPLGPTAFATFVAALATLAPGPAHALLALNQHSIHLDANGVPQLKNLLGERPLSIEQLTSISTSANTYEEFIAQLKNTAPELFKRPVLLHQSGSLQFASLDRPRVLLFGRGAVLAFAEDPTKPTRDVEILSFNPASSRFEAAEIRFRPGLGPEVQINPPVCAACHGRGNELRPLWQPYDIWPGAYGAQAGLIRGPELKPYQAFIAAPGKPGIYRAIEPESPARTGSKIDTMDNFSQYISSLSLLRTMGELKRRLGPSHPMRYALTAAFNGCAIPNKTGRKGAAIPIQEFLPPALRSRFKLEGGDLAKDALDERTTLLARLKVQYRRYFPGSNPDFSLTSRLDFEAEVVGPARFLLENLGIEWSSFTMSHGEHRMSIQMPSLLPLDVGTALGAFDPTLFSELRPKKVPDGNGLDWRVFDCGTLQRRSLEALATGSVTLSALPALSKRHAGSGLAPMARCTECHVHETEKNEAPLLPLDQMVKLGEWLRKDGNLAKTSALIRAGKMPADSRLETVDQDALIEAFGRIAGE